MRVVGVAAQGNMVTQQKCYYLLQKLMMHPESHELFSSFDSDGDGAQPSHRTFTPIVTVSLNDSLRLLRRLLSPRSRVAACAHQPTVRDALCTFASRQAFLT